MIKSIPIYILLVVSTLYGCVATSHYYTARTVEENTFAFGIGADDIAIESADQTIEVSKKAVLIPSIAIAYGLPYRLETGLRWYPPRFLEGSLRYQINPPTFHIVDGSINLTFAHLFGGYSYLRYGISISKNIHEFEPFVHYSFYNFLGADKGDFSDSFISGAIDDFISNNRSIGFGVALPIRKAKLFPEVDYQYFDNDIDKGLWRFGVGICVYID
jgi:hypothetical protein